MATVIPKKGQIVLTKEAFDAKADAGELVPGAEYLITNIQYVTTTEADMILQSAKDYTDIEANKKVDKTSVSESVVANSVVKRTTDGDILVNDDNTAMASKPSNIAVSKGYVQYIMTTLSELFGQNLEVVISSISSSASTDGYTQTLTFKNLNNIGIGTLDIVIPKTELEIVEDNTLFKYTFTLKDSKGNTLSTKTIDLPLEELVVDGSYDNTTKSIVLTLKNGNTVDIPVGDLIEGLVTSTDLQNALSNYATLEQVNAKYTKPNTGIPKTDLDDDVQASLDKANTALQEHQSLANYATKEEVNAKYTKPSTGIPKTDLDSSVQASLDKANTALQEHQDISGKVDKINGKGLSTNDYTDADKAKLLGLADIKSIGDNLTLDAQGKLNTKVASIVSSVNGQTGAVTGIATTEEVNTAKQSANSYTDTKIAEKVDKFKVVYNKDDAKIAYNSRNGISPGETLSAQNICVQIRSMDIVYVETNLGKAILHLQPPSYGVNYGGATFTTTNGGSEAITAQMYIWLYGADEIRYIKQTAYIINNDYTIAPKSLSLIIYKIYGGNQL